MLSHYIRESDKYKEQYLDDLVNDFEKCIIKRKYGIIRKYDKMNNDNINPMNKDDNILLMNLVNG